MIDARLTGVARTSLLTLRARAEEHGREDAILDDSWSADWQQHAPAIPELEAWYNPTFQLATAIRSRLIDDLTGDWLQEHKTPLVVELGAGLSTRYYRVAPESGQWVEQDLAEAIAVRQKLDVERAAHWFVSGEMTAEDWLDRLPEADPQDVLFIAEGALMFLEPAEVAALLRRLQTRFPGASIVLDVVRKAYLERLNASFTQLDAPVQWAADPDELKKLGLKVQSTHYLLLEYPERWEQIGVEAEKRTQERSGCVVYARFS